MHLTQLRLPKTPENAKSLARLMASRYAEHQVLWELSGAPRDSKREFLYRCDITAAGVEMLVLSPQAFTAVDDAWEMRSKAYAPVFTQGQLLAFKLRVSPTIDKSRAGQRSLRQDLVRLVYAEAEGAITLDVAAQAAGKRWLDARAEASGFKVIECDAGGYETHVMQEKGASIRIPSLDVQGVLVVQDPVAFTARQALGFGKSRFAGMGLMVVRPA